MQTVKTLIGAAAFALLGSTAWAQTSASPESYDVNQVDQVAAGTMSPQQQQMQQQQRNNRMKGTATQRPTSDDDEQSYSVSQIDQVAQAVSSLRAHQPTADR